MLSDKLVVRSVNILLVVRIVFNNTLSVLVVNGETFDQLVMYKELVVYRILYWYKCVRIVARDWMMLVAMRSLSIALSHLNIGRLHNVHAKEV